MASFFLQTLYNNAKTFSFAAINDTRQNLEECTNLLSHLDKLAKIKQTLILTNMETHPDCFLTFKGFKVRNKDLGLSADKRVET